MKLLAQQPTNPFGVVSPPPGVNAYGEGDFTKGLPLFVNNILKFLIVGAGIYSLINLVLAGYDFLGAGNDPKKIANAWGKIWQTLLGLAITAGAFILAALFGQIIFGDANALLQLKIFGPE